MKARTLKCIIAAVCALLTAALLAAASAPSAAAAQTRRHYNIEEASLNISVPSDYLVVTPETDESDPVLEQLGLTADELHSRLAEQGIRLEAFSPDFRFMIHVIVQPSEYGSLRGMSEKEKRSFLKGVEQAIEDSVGGRDDVAVQEAELTERNGVDYFRLSSSYVTDMVESDFTEYATIRNYRAICLSFYGYRLRGEPADASQAEEMEALIQRVLETVSFTDTDTAPTVSSTGKRRSLLVKVGSAALTGAVLGGISTIINSANKKKARESPLAEETAPAGAAYAKQPNTGADGTIPGAYGAAAAPPAAYGAAGAGFPQRGGAPRPSGAGAMCGRCGSPVPNENQYCPNCGAPVRVSFDEIVAAAQAQGTAAAARAEDAYAAALAEAAPARRCRHCGKPLPENRIYCPFCGTKYGDRAPE